MLKRDKQNTWAFGINQQPRRKMTPDAQRHREENFIHSTVGKNCCNVELDFTASAGTILDVSPLYPKYSPVNASV